MIDQHNSGILALIMMKALIKIQCRYSIKRWQMYIVYPLPKQACLLGSACWVWGHARPGTSSAAAVSLAGLLYWAPPAARAEAGQRQGQGTPGGFPWSRAAEHQLAQLQLSSRATLELPRPRTSSATAHWHLMRTYVLLNTQPRSPPILLCTNTFCPHWCTG